MTKRDDKKVMSPALLFSRVPRRLLCRRTNQYTFTLAPDVTPLHILSVATPSCGAVKGGRHQRGRAVGGPNKAGSALAQASSRYLPAEATANDPARFPRQSGVPAGPSATTGSPPIRLFYSSVDERTRRVAGSAAYVRVGEQIANAEGKRSVNKCASCWSHRWQ